MFDIFCVFNGASILKSMVMLPKQGKDSKIDLIKMTKVHKSDGEGTVAVE